ncbi:MAG: PocR ligand-binding domain-containing protein [Sporolactobacillus sp.]
MNSVELDAVMDSPDNEKYQQIQKRILNEVGIRHIIDLQALQKVQDDLADITGLSMVIVDSKGIPLTQESSFSAFCAARRKILTCKENCFFSDAYGGLKAAISNAPYVYRCPVGLVDCAVPIIVSDQHLGAVLMGQVRCEDSESLENVKKFVMENISEEHSADLIEKYKNTSTFELSKIQMIGNMIYFITKEMMEKQLGLLVQQELEKENHDLQNQLLKKEKQVQSIRKIEKKQMKVELTPQFLMSAMNALSNLSVIEGANQTNELACLFARMLRYAFENNREFVDLDKEIADLKDYLRIQQIRLGEKFDYKIDIRCTTQNKRIPKMIFFPFVENAILHGILPLKKKGAIKITITDQLPKNYILSIHDNGIGMDQNDADRLLEDSELNQSNRSALVGIGIHNTRNRLIGYFGEDYDLVITTSKNQGFTLSAKIPLVIKENDGDEKT